jgi:hypothetical protein
VTQTNLITAYFRTHFSFSGDRTRTILRIQGKLDDGGVVYLNGVELARIGMPAAPVVIDHSTLAPRSVGDTDPEDAVQLYFPSALRSGDNVLAVSLHQANLTSSDTTLGLRLLALTQSPLAIASSLRISLANQNVTILWSPAVGTLQSLDNLTGAWQDVSPQPAVGGPYSVPASAASRFYRVRP